MILLQGSARLNRAFFYQIGRSYARNIPTPWTMHPEPYNQYLNLGPCMQTPDPRPETLQGCFAHKNYPPPNGHHMALGMVLL